MNNGTVHNASDPSPPAAEAPPVRTGTRSDMQPDNGLYQSSVGRRQWPERASPPAHDRQPLTPATESRAQRRTRT
jgi:hypothetical protein